MSDQPDGPLKEFPGPSDIMQSRSGASRRLAIIIGQDKSRFTDFYHATLTANWLEFFIGLAVVFLAINLLFALLYWADPHGIANARPGSLADAFFFSVQTLGSIGYGAMTPHSTYANVLVTIESFSSIVNIAVATGLVFARFSRPTARVLFSNVAVVTQFDGVPTLMFRAANQRGNQIFDANVTVSLARQVVTREGINMRRFEELRLVRSRTPLFALSWTVMHRIDETSPLYGQTPDSACRKSDRIDRPSQRHRRYVVGSDLCAPILSPLPNPVGAALCRRAFADRERSALGRSHPLSRYRAGKAYFRPIALFSSSVIGPSLKRYSLQLLVEARLAAADPFQDHRGVLDLLARVVQQDRLELFVLGVVGALAVPIDASSSSRSEVIA